MMNLLEEQIKRQGQYVEDVRKMRHDMYAHLLVMHYYLKANNVEKTKEYLDGLLEQQKEFEYPFIELGNDIANAVVQSLLARTKVDIEFIHNGLLPEDFAMETQDICILFSNLFSNAIEACEVIESGEKKIELCIGREDEALCIILQNTRSKAAGSEFREGISGKSDNEIHGYGTRNIRSVVEKYSGKVEFSAKEGLFLVKVRLAQSDKVCNKTE